MSEIKEKAAKLEKFKYPLIILIVGVVLMLIPGKSTYLNTPSGTDEPLKTVLSCTNGVGRAEVIASECGVVVVCDGAEDARDALAVELGDGGGDGGEERGEERGGSRVQIRAVVRHPIRVAVTQDGALLRDVDIEERPAVALDRLLHGGQARGDGLRVGF